RKAEALTHKGPVAELVNQFQECMSYVNWSEQTKIVMFNRKLKPDLRRTLLASPKKDTLDEWAPIVIDKDNELHELEVDLRREEKISKPKATGNGRPSDRSYRTSAPDTNGPTPMEVDALRQAPRGPLTPEERAYRDANGLCRYCGGKHKIAECP
ncbi:hypothetical protein BD309DRAFT_836063, partial [Dichomitus squalens]